MSVAPFHGWRVVRAAFVVAFFGWGVGFYGPPVFLHAVHEARGWAVPLVSAAVTLHFLFGAVVTGNLAALHRRFGVAAVTRGAAVTAAVGVLGWAVAGEPWQIFLAALLTGAGWAATSGAAINAIVAPWFVRRRPAALSAAYNGASVGGVVLSPLWVALIAAFGFAGAAVLVGAAMVLALWWLTARTIGPVPADLGQHPDSEAAVGPARPVAPSRPGGALWRSRAFATLAVATSLSLFAQIGLIAHLYSLLVPALGGQGAGFAAGLATACAIVGRTGLGWLLPEGADRRRAAAGNAAVQVAGSLVLLAAGGTSVPLLLLGIVLFGLGLGNATSLPPLIAQRDFAPADTARVVALVTACSQAAYAFAPAVFGLLRDLGPGPVFVAAAVLQVAGVMVLLAGRGGSSRAARA